MRTVLIGLALVAGPGALEFFGTGGPDRPMPIPDAAPGMSQDALRPVKDNAIAYKVGDVSIDNARQMAAQTLPRFQELIGADLPATYTVKFPLTQNGATEHIWMQLDGYRNGRFVGRLANEPVNGRRYKMGDRMEVADAEIEDWMVNTGSEMYGGYTVRAMLKDMPQDQADRLRTMFRD